MMLAQRIRVIRTLASVATKTPATTDASFSPDGTLLATASSDKTARPWHVAARDRATLLGETGERTDYRVCRDTLEVVAVIPSRKPETVWAPARLCRPATK